MRRNSERSPSEEGMRRRDFLKAGAAGAAGCLAGPGLGRAVGQVSPVVPDPTGDFEWEEASISELRAAMRAGRLTSAGLTRAYSERIEAVDRSGPSLNAVIEVNPDALPAAEALDEEERRLGPRGPLHGIPILIKANIDTADRMATTAGSLALAGSIAPQDAGLVERLRKAGAVVLGKTNLSEWANFRSTRSSSGWSSLGGQTKNPHALDRNPSGSSSGSAVAAAASLCAAAVGTETDGSVVSPASLNGIVGIKPTVGQVSRFGIIPIAHSQDTAGPMARSVADAAALLSGMAGPDPRDPATLREKHAMGSFSQFLKADALKKARVGVARRYFGFHEKVDRLMENALAVLKEAGATIFDPVEIEPVEKYGDAEFQVLLYEFKSGLNAYLKKRGETAPVHSLSDIIRFNQENRSRVMPFFEQEILLMAEDKGSLTEKAYTEALDRCRRLSRREGLDSAFEKHSLDAVVMPTDGPAWKTDLVNGDFYLGGSSRPAAVSGYPSITVPAGAIFGLPVGLSFVGRPFRDGDLLGLAYAFEQCGGFRTVPRFSATADLGI